MLEKEKQGKTNKIIVLQESIPSSIYWTCLLAYIIYIYDFPNWKFVFGNLHWEGPVQGVRGREPSTYQ